MPSIVSLTRFIAEIGLTLSIPHEVVATSFVYLHAAIKELSLTQLASDAVALATAALLLAAKTTETSVKQNDIVEVAVKLAAEKPTLSIEIFAQRKRILKDKAGFFETLIVRLHPLDCPLGFFYLTGICDGNAALLQIAHKLLLDFYRSSLALDLSPQTIAEGAKAVASLVLSDAPVTMQSLGEHAAWLPDLLGDVYT